MTRNKEGHNLLAQDSAKPPIGEATPVTEDGPEEYSESGSRGLSEDDEVKASKQGTVRKGFGSGEKSATNSPGQAPDPFALRSSQYGSPFAYLSYQDRHDFFKGLLSDGTCMLFDQVVAEASFLRRHLSEDPALTNDGNNGHFCALKIRDADSSFDEGDDSDGSQLQFYVFEHAKDQIQLPVVDTIEPIDSTSFGWKKNSIAEEKVEIRRYYNSTTGEDDYYVMEHDFDCVTINGVYVDQHRPAGPLPDFAVLELGRRSYFWWRTADALDYVPSLKRKRQCEPDPEDNNEEPANKVSKGDTGCSPNSSLFSPRMFPDPQLSDSRVSDSQVSLDSKSWLSEYRHRLKICEQRPVRYTALITDLHPPHEYPDGEMHETDVILAIGSVLLGLQHAKVEFAYANSLLFAVARSMRMVGVHAVNRNNHFIIPLLFNEELSALSPEPEEDTVEPLKPVFSAFQRGEEEKNQENYAAAEQAKQNDPGNKNKPPPSLKDQESQNKNHIGGIGHFMLVIAEKVERDVPSTIKDLQEKKALVRLRFMDSATGVVKRGSIRRVARNTVRNSGWLGDIWPYFDGNEEYWVDVLRQSWTKCGEHTVLNAWAYMLEIPLATTRDRSLGSQSYREVRKMIDLALRGQLDGLTIRAWMQHSRYAVEEPLSQRQQDQIENPGSPKPLRNMESVALNEYAFNEIIDEMYMREQVAVQDHASLWGDVQIPVDPDGATVQQSRHASKVAGIDLPPSGQAPVASSSGTPGKPDGATSQQSRHAPKVASGIALPPSDQAPVANSSGAHRISASAAGPAENSPTTPTSIPPPRTWRQSLLRGLTVNKALKMKYPRTTEDTSKSASIIPNSSEMAEEDVVLAIAPIWEGLKRLGRPYFDFTYAGTDVFTTIGQQRVGAVGGWSRFIMPLFFTGEGKALESGGKGKEKFEQLRHALLVVAELVDDHPMTVQLQMYDSGTDQDLRQIAVLQAKQIINRSGWLGTNQFTAPIVYKNTTFRTVPRQVGFKTMGLHVIMNAWAYMLDIPVEGSHFRRGRTEKDRFDPQDLSFLKQGLEIVNLALEGFMDSDTIQAFFNVHGYCAEQRFGDPARAVIPVNAVGMNPDKFRRTLQHRKWSSMLAYARAQGRLFLDEDLAYLMNEGLSQDQAWTALVVSNGNRRLAFHWHFDSDVPGEFPDPKNALSPTTPDRRMVRKL